MTQAPHQHQPPVAPPADDAAQQSLSDALRVSFGMLRAVMILMVVLYLISGIYQVGEQETAVVTRFGKIVTDDSGVAKKDSGLYFGLPFPIDNVVTVPTSERSLDIPQSFVYEGEGRPGPLNPERDGSLITGDANIVHARFSTQYVISDPVAFISNFGDPDAVTVDRMSYGVHGGGPSLSAQRTGQQIADALVINMVEQGIVHAIASVKANDVIGGRFNADEAKLVAQRQLDELDVGITLTNIAMRLPEMPLSVRDAYGLVAQSEATKSTLINTAESERTKLLGEAAGKAALPISGADGPLVKLIKEYEIATTLDDEAKLQALEAQLSAAFRQLAINDGETQFDIGGETATIINNALIEKSQITERIKTEAETVLELKEAFERDPNLFKERRWQYVVREIFDENSGIELFYAPSGQRLQLDMNRDPDIANAKSRQKLEDEVNNAAGR